jgi:N-acetyl-alpha-D-muramate 1-phosphate uridylyltransferase
VAYFYVQTHSELILKMKAIILAAGHGRRLKPITDTIPKALVKIGGKPLLLHVIEKLSSEGVNEFYINLHYLADSVKSFLDNKRFSDIAIHLSLEDKLLDTGGGIKRIVKKFSINEPILIYNADIMSTIPTNELMKAHLDNECLATMALQDRPTDKYLLFDEDNLFCGRAKNDKTASNLVRLPKGKMNALAFCGIYIVGAQCFKDYSVDIFSSIDLFLEQTFIGKKVKGKRYDSCYWSDIGTLDELNKTRSLLKTNPHALISGPKV